jgi:hypothetical protein
MKQGRNRTMSICLTDLPKERIFKHENGKMYLNLSTYDYEAPDKFDNDFSVSLPLTKDELERKKNGQTINRIFLGSGKIWPDKQGQPLTQEEQDDLPF